MKIKKAVVIEMINHAKKEMPLECCGYLAAEGSMVVASYALTNVDKSSFLSIPRSSLLYYEMYEARD